MILGSGGLVHNLSKLEWEKPGLSAPEEWAVRFQSWALNVLRLRDFESLCDFKERGPDASVAHPTWEHFAPLLFAAGAASAWGEDLVELYSGWTYGSLSMATVGFGKIFRDA
jgi:4,5-DOPA dioxygenase extradiol